MFLKKCQAAKMTVDLDKLNIAARLRGVSHVDAVFDPLFAHGSPGFRGHIDSLYVYGSSAVHLLQPPSSSTYEGWLCAIRWHDPDPNRQHGGIQWFGFPSTSSSTSRPRKPSTGRSTGCGRNVSAPLDSGLSY